MEALHALAEQVTYQMQCGAAAAALAGPCALLKVQGSKTFEHCAREASQILGVRSAPQPACDGGGRFCGRGVRTCNPACAGGLADAGGRARGGRGPMKRAGVTRAANRNAQGASFVEGEGQGATVERLYREVRGTAIPGGSEEIMLDLAMRQARL